MKRYKKLIILGAILVVVVIAIIVVSRIKVHQEQINSTVETILEIDPETVTQLSWEYDETNLDFSRDESSEDEKWIYSEDENFPVSSKKINSLLGNFEEFETEFTIDDVEDYSQYGLEKPMCTVNITAGDTTYEIKFGDYSTMDSERYVSIGDGKVYLASVDPTDDFNIELSDMIENDDIPSFEQVDTISVAGVDDYDIYADRTETLSVCADDIYFTDIDSQAKPLDTTKVNSYISLIKSMDMSEYATYNATDDDIAQYGLDDPEVSMEIGYSYTDEEAEGDEDAAMLTGTFKIAISRSAEDKAAINEAIEAGEDASEDSYSAYVRIGDSKIIYVISASDYAEFALASYDDLRHDNLFTADFEQVTSIDVTIDGNSYTFVKQNTDDDTSDETTAFFLNDEEVAISDFQTALEALSINGFTDSDPTGQIEISLKLHLDNENFSEIDIDLYRYDGTFCSAVLDGENIGLVDRSSVVDLMEAVNAIVLD